MNGAWAWLTDSASWSGTGGIAARVMEHLQFTVLILVIASLIAIPLGVYVGHTGRGRWLISLANSMRAVPSLALLLVITLWLGPLLRGEAAFIIPGVTVLVILAIPPILAGAYAGVESVDPAARDAAAGMGMTARERLASVEIPCSIPLLMSGLRSAALQVVATLIIAAYVGMGGLGRFLIDGLAQQNYPMMAGGAILVSTLAILVEFVLALIQRVVLSPGLRSPSWLGQVLASGRLVRTSPARGAATSSHL